jgi:predicted dehydrogenase
MTAVSFAIVGCGRVSSRHIDALTNKVEGARIVAVCDAVAAAAETCGKALQVSHFVSTAEMYKAAQIDCVVVITPSGDHHRRVMEALDHDKHVVVEKPISLRLDHADEMIREARKRGRKLWVAFQNRYNPAVMKAKEAVESGRLGKMVIGTVRVRWSRDQSYYDHGNWHGTWAMDGGVISQQAIHHIDALRWMMGEVETVEAQCSTRLVKIECEDLCVASLRFKSGALGIVEAMTAARPRDFEASLSLMGENGTVILGGLALNKVDMWEFAVPHPEDTRVPELFSQEIPNAFGFGHDVLYNRVVNSILNNGPVEISGEEGRKALEVVQAIYASHEQGTRVDMKNQPVSSRLGIG